VPAILSLDFAYYFIQLVAGAITGVCLIALIFSQIEPLVLQMAGVRNLPRYRTRPLTAGLTAIGLLGFVGSGVWWLSTATEATRGLGGSMALAFWLSAALFDIGALAILTSETRAD
jgi:hypothetical protein